MRMDSARAFSWDGSDECDRPCGRGWATLEEDGSLAGRIYLHPATIPGFARSKREPTRTGVSETELREGAGISSFGSGVYTPPDEQATGRYR